MEQLKGFFPDLDATTPNIITACVNAIPTTRGFAASKTLAPVNLTGALSGLPIAAALLALNEGTNRTLVATQTGIAEVAAGSWTSRFTHATTATNVSFATLGNISLMANGVDNVSAAPLTLGFTEIAEAPVTSLIVSASGFVMALGYSDHPDGWWCSGLFDHTEWTPSETTQAANGTLYQTPGPITAATSLNDDVIAFKRNAVYRGRYVGLPNIWEWDVLSSDVGCVGPRAVCSTPNGLVFVGHDDIYLLSTSGIQPLGAGVRLWLFSELNRSYESSIYVQYGKTERLVYIGVPTNTGGGVVNSVLVYNPTVQAFGRLTNAGLPSGVYTAAAVVYNQGAVTIDGLDALYATIDDISEQSDSPLWVDNKLITAVVGSDGILYTLTGPANQSSMTLSIIGSLDRFTRLTRVVPYWLDSPASGSLALLTSNDHVENLQQAKTAALFGRAFNVVRSARWLQVKLEFTGDFELVNITYETTAEGSR